MDSLHGKLKNWLVDIGKENSYDARTPDEQNDYEFSKLRNAKVNYIPDVVWKKRREKVLFELAFTERPVAVIGEMFLASHVEGFSKIYFIRRTKHTDKWEDVATFLRLAFRKNEGALKDYQAHRPGFVFLDPSLEETEIKQRIVKQLEEDHWIAKKE